MLPEQATKFPLVLRFRIFHIPNRKWGVNKMLPKSKICTCDRVGVHLFLFRKSNYLTLKFNTMSALMIQIVLALNLLLGNQPSNTQLASQIMATGAYKTNCGVVIIDTDEL